MGHWAGRVLSGEAGDYISIPTRGPSALKVQMKQDIHSIRGILLPSVPPATDLLELNNTWDSQAPSSPGRYGYSTPTLPSIRHTLDYMGFCETVEPMKNADCTIRN